MWWNNVETKPGTGYPGKWEDQDTFQGGWVVEDDELKLRAAGKKKGLLNLFHNPNLPVLDDYEPWTYKYLDLIQAPPADDQVIARPISLITGKPMEIKSGPNWDDDLSGTPDYARNDPNLKNLSPAERESMFQLERMAFYYLPRMCNHCLNPACVASCPSGAIYKRGEDGVVLINQDVCRGWRMCVSACPYKKTYFNWKTGKSEKCILCYPRLESDQAPACMHSCVGRIRYLGVILYDADKIHEAASSPDETLIDNHMDALLDPFDPEVIAAAKANGVADSTIDAAQKSPTYRFVKKWGLAMPLHAEFRTLPMLFYVPPLLPVMASLAKVNHDERGANLNPAAKHWSDNWLYDTSTEELWGSIDQARFPLKYMANLFSNGDEKKIAAPLKKLMAVRIYRRWKTVGDISEEKALQALTDTGLTPEEADDIYYMTSLAKFTDRIVIPAAHREQAIEMLENTGDAKGSIGFGTRNAPDRGN
jgi:nitrate reductase beta subunit